MTPRGDPPGDSPHCEREAFGYCPAWITTAKVAYSNSGVCYQPTSLSTSGWRPARMQGAAYRAYWLLRYSTRPRSGTSDRCRDGAGSGRHFSGGAGAASRRSSVHEIGTFAPI